MLALTGHNPMGNVLHVILGPETEFFVDIHGAKILDVTELIKIMKQDERIYLSVTRCKNEGQTEKLLSASEAPYLSSFMTGTCNNPDCPDCKTDKGASKTTTQKSPPKKAKCNYCHQTKELLPLPGFNICTACAQIELGLKGLDKDEPPKKPRKTRKKKDE